VAIGLAVGTFCGAAPALAQEGLDWSLGLRGSYISNSLSGGHAETVLTPEAALVLGGEAGTLRLSAGSALAFDSDGQGRVADIHGGAEGSYRLGATTLLDGELRLGLTQARPDASGLPANTLHAPLLFDGTARGSVTQDLGRVDVTATLAGARHSEGKTTLDDLTTLDNTDQSNWQGGATLRVGYELTPLLAAFVEGEASVQKFDAPDPALARLLDGRTYQLRGGASYRQGSVIAAEASVGRAWLDYVDPALTDRQSWVYNASLTVQPDETVSLTGGFETSIGPSGDVAGDTDVRYALSGAARYRVNPWLTLRGSAGWDRKVTLGAKTASGGYEAGGGFDLQTARHVVWSADYLYRHEAPPQSDTHTVTVGVRLQK
jgi:hypothetical protein